MAALRFGLRGSGGGGTELEASRVRRARWVVLRAWSSACNALELGMLGAERAFVEGSRCKGRRVKVSSIAADSLCFSQIEGKEPVDKRCECGGRGEGERATVWRMNTSVAKGCIDAQILELCGKR